MLYCTYNTGSVITNSINHARFHSPKIIQYGFITLLLDVQEEGIHDKYTQGGSNMTGTDLCVNKPHCAAAVRP